MDQLSNGNRVELPSGVSQRLLEFQRRVKFVKLAEGVLAALFGLALSYLAVFIADRFTETSGWVRGLILLGGATGPGLFLPLKWHRWVWRQRRLEQVARLLRFRFPRLSDQLLGVIELAHADSDSGRSARLVQAAMEQVDRETRDRDFTDAVPNPRHRRWAWAAGLPLALMLIALVVVPAAGSNALLRWLAPWSDTDRYTFVQLDNVPDELVVPIAEPFDLDVALSEKTEWKPQSGSAQYGRQAPVTSQLDKDSKYDFGLPPQELPDTLKISVGDARKKVAVTPKTRPELTALKARVELPKYLQRETTLEKDIRGGSVTVVRGSRAVFEATASRELAMADFDGQRQSVSGDTIVTAPQSISETKKHRFSWKDIDGLTAREPFELKVLARDDEAPTLTARKLSDGQILLEDEVLSFELAVSDDFGVQQVGLEWAGVEDPLSNPNPAKGEKIVAAGDPDATELNATAAFSARREGIKPQALQVRAWAVDYHPTRGKVYSPAYTLYVLSAEDHAMWLTDQFRRWYRQAQEVHGKERQLYETNLELRKHSPEELDRPDVRKQIEAQASAERANSRRLGALTNSGAQLIRQAMRNDQFNVATLETWSEMQKALEDIAQNRMPSVAELLKEAADAPGSGQPTDGQASNGKPSDQQGDAQSGKPNGKQNGQPGGQKDDKQSKSQQAGQPGDPSDKPSAPSVGENHNQQAGGDNSPSKPKLPNDAKPVPKINDVESGFNKIEPQEKKDDEDQEPKKAGSGRLTLPNTTLIGGPTKKGGDGKCPAQEKLDEAVAAQEDLLAEFEKVSDELAKILGNLEGSTFVKRLKAASRRQLEIAGDLNHSVSNSFGVSQSKAVAADVERAEKIAEREIAQSDSVYLIEQDLEAYFNRVHQVKFQKVLDEMRELRVVTELKAIGEIAKKNLSGTSIAEAEFWADTLDRWGEQLVGPGCPGGQCPGAKSADSLPPSIVLEVLNILEDEMELREETRSLEQARMALKDDDYSQKAGSLAGTQTDLSGRTEDVVFKISELPNGSSSFAKELKLLVAVKNVMDDAATILESPDTGAPAIAAETEAIELLLQAKRQNPKGGGGGGGGTTPGGGGSGTTTESAIAQVGRGDDREATIEEREVEQSTGLSGRQIPEEFRSGLDKYFNGPEGASGAGD
ncbi:hypothetical protein GC176_13175 [bacterium]|nr:hypothetical protein [bacterium]